MKTLNLTKENIENLRSQKITKENNEGGVDFMIREAHNQAIEDIITILLVELKKLN